MEASAFSRYSFLLGRRAYISATITKLNPTVREFVLNAYDIFIQMLLRAPVRPTEKEKVLSTFSGRTALSLIHTNKCLAGLVPGLPLQL